MIKTGGLGKGLSSLIPKKQKIEIKNGDEKISDDKNVVLSVDINLIRANDYQPRENFIDDDLDSLSASIKEHGILQPLIVNSEKGGVYELIAGERRLRAAKKAELAEVPIIIKEADNLKKFQLALIENIQRADLNPIELAKSFQKLIDEFEMSHSDIAKKMGKSRPAITNMLRLLNLPKEIQGAIAEKKINFAQARALSSLSESEQTNLFRKMLSGRLTSREAEMEAKKISVKSHQRTIKKDPNIAAKEEKLQQALGTKTLIKQRGGKGKILIDFYSQEELSAIVRKIAN
ncbi:MAG: ParB/RepB/Spo0J family partition protein [Patescibacteria group bacterium]|nr:ParB/RepB/Spo0J family partition protein [Patescibacteria group bacterium]